MNGHRIYLVRVDDPALGSEVLRGVRIAVALMPLALLVDVIVALCCA